VAVAAQAVEGVVAEAEAVAVVVEGAEAGVEEVAEAVVVEGAEAGVEEVAEAAEAEVAEAAEAEEAEVEEADRTSSPETRQCGRGPEGSRGTFRQRQRRRV
jgi:hypothetical protein